jgi:hypothetical protein
VSRGVSRRVAAAVAVVASLAVYVIPLVGPHAVQLWGRALTRAGDRSAAWVATDWTLALAAQAVAAVVVYFLLRRPGWLTAVAAPAVALGLVVAVNLLEQAVVPLAFLVERDTAPAHGEWAVACSLADVTLMPGPLAGDLALARAGEAWVLRAGELRLGVLTMPGCAITSLGLTWSNVGRQVVAVAPGGRALIETQAASTTRLDYAYLAGPGRTPAPLPVLADRPAPEGRPILSGDGTWMAWIERDVTAPARPATVRVVPVDGGVPRAVSLHALEPASFVVVELDAGGEVVLARNEREFLGLGFDGARRWGPLTPDGIQPLSFTFRRLGAGWVAWDGYQEREAYRVAWQTPYGRSVHRIPRGRSLVAVAPDPEGRHVALSTTGAYSIGEVPDAVVVLRTADGGEVFRRYLPRYTRSGVAFLGSGYFAYVEGDARQSRLQVLRVPAP